MTPPASDPVSVVIATRGRPELLRSAIRAILGQEHGAEIEVVVVFDRIEIDPLDDIVVPPHRRLTRIANTRTPGLAGGRNSGIVAASHSLIAFCDDDDEWLPGKLSRQVSLWADHPDAVLIASGIRIATGDEMIDRLPPASVGFDDLLRSRITEMHPSSFLLRRADLQGGIGLVDEELPASYGEDYDLLLRAARLGPIRSVVEPLVLVRWNRASFFSEKWIGIAAGLSYLLQKFPEFEREPRGAARIEGQVAFAYAAAGERRPARVWARRTLRHHPGELRAWAAYLVALRLVSATRLVRMINRRGKGL